MNPSFWKKKLAAWIHDPAEKALVLMRDVVSHENGSLAQLRSELGIEKSDFDKRADWFAAGADRPQWPNPEGQSRPSWATVGFTEKPVLIHPLSGENIELAKLSDIQAAHIRSASLAHFSELIERDADGKPDYRLTQLAFWRFGPEPELVAPEIGALWRVLPADTRVPDHSIWAHLDMVSALTGAMVDDEPALLAMSFGPVQSFIAQARSTSDLWAGSHLLSALVWEGLKIIAAELGPDALLFPNLRGVAAVDLWVLDSLPASRKDHWRERFKKIRAEWLKSSTDSNPLFAATLPNKFMVLVPAKQAEALAKRVTLAMRNAVKCWAMEAGNCVFDQVDGHWQQQIQAQLDGFPEAHWAVARWPLDKTAEGLPDASTLKSALAQFGNTGLFDTEVWKLLNKEIILDGAVFFKPNAGILYPAVHELAERALAASKSLRDFTALPQQGYRCSLCGEREWLTATLDYDSINSQAPTVLDLPTTPRKEIRQGGRKGTVWNQVVGRFGIKEGEYLCGLCTLKRLWPTLYTQRVAEFLGDNTERFVISTHTLALASALENLLHGTHPTPVAADMAQSARHELSEAIAAHERQHGKLARVALPRALLPLTRQLEPTRLELAKKLPALLDARRELGLEDAEEGSSLDSLIERATGRKPERYYALIQMDGDKMGAWMASNEEKYQLPFEQSWHPQVQAAVKSSFSSNQALTSYRQSLRPASPARHAAISGALNDFSTHIARHIVETVFKGKLLYAGGDDVLAMVSVDDVLPAMLLLRAAYSGTGDVAGMAALSDLKKLKLGKGYVHLGDRLMLTMGGKATASIGAVVAHHQAPLAGVLRKLRAAEQEAKNHGRDAFCLRVLKRGGGEVKTTSHFWRKTKEPPLLTNSALGLLWRFAETLDTEMSRRAVYIASTWLTALPSRPAGDDMVWRDMVTTNLAFQFGKQSGTAQHASEFVELACSESPEPADTVRVLNNLLATAEFFAREGRISSTPGATS